jgi:NinB protein
MPYCADSDTRLSNANWYAPDMRQIVLLDEDRRARAVTAVLQAQLGQVVTIKEATRNAEQSARLHAICTDLAKGGVQWLGKRRSTTDWKILLVSGHAVATRQGHEMLPGLEGEFVNLRESTAQMSKSRMSSLIDYATAWAAQHTEQA